MLYRWVQKPHITSAGSLAVYFASSVILSFKITKFEGLKFTRFCVINCD
jgi:hypothetical protein